MIKKVMTAIAVLILCFATSVYGDVVVDGKDVVGSFDTGGDYTPTGTWDWSTATVTWPTNLATYNGIAPSADIQALLGSDSYATARTNLGTWGVSGSITDEQLVCGETTGGTNLLKSCGAKTTDNSTASHGIYKDASGYIANQVLTIDAHAASTTITLIAGICPIIHNASQADSNIDNTLPAVGAGKCFVALATSVEADKYWRLTAAAANTVCLNRTCGKDYIQFDTPAVGDTFSCMSDGTSWYCYDYDSSATAGDL